MGTETGTGCRPLRRDAERNRQLILEAAREVFAEHGLEAGLHDIAKRAGVGVGTVYRRFPDKDELIDALFEDRIDEVVAMADAALAAVDAWDGLKGFLEGGLALQAADRGLHECVFSRADAHKRATSARRRIAPRVAKLVERAQAEGSLRADVGAYDVGMLRQMLGGLIERTRETDPEAWRRYLTVVLDGLRAARDDASPLPGSVPGQRHFERAMRAG